MTPREKAKLAIADEMRVRRHRFSSHGGKMRDGTTTPEQILEALTAAGFAVVPVELIENAERFLERTQVDALMSGPRYKGFLRGKIAGRTVEDDMIALGNSIRAAKDGE